LLLLLLQEESAKEGLKLQKMLGHLLLENHRQGLEQFQGLSVVGDVEQICSESVLSTLDDVEIVNFASDIPLPSMAKSYGVPVDDDQHINRDTQQILMTKSFGNHSTWFSVHEIVPHQKLDLNSFSNVDDILKFGLENMKEFAPQVLRERPLCHHSMLSSINDCEVLRMCIADVCEGSNNMDLEFECISSQSERVSTIALWKMCHRIQQGLECGTPAMLKVAMFLLSMQLKRQEPTLDQPSRRIDALRGMMLKVSFTNDEEKNNLTLWRIVLRAPDYVECTTSITLENGVGDVAVVSCSSDQSSTKILNANNPTCTIRGPITVLSGIGSQSLTLTSAVTLQGNSTSWYEHQREAGKQCLNQLALRLLKAVYMSMIPLSPFFEGVIIPPQPQHDISTLQSSLQISGDWQTRLFPAVYWALCTCCCAKRVEAYLKKRWRLEWVSVFQGSGNSALRDQLYLLCEAVTTHCSRSFEADPIIASKTLQLWVRNGVTPLEISEVLAKSKQNFEIVECVLKICETVPASADSILKSWTTEVTRSGIWKPLEGNFADSTNQIHQRFLSLLSRCSEPVRLEILAQHSFDSSFLETMLRFDSLCEPPQVLQPRSTNMFFTTHPQVRIVRAGINVSEIERTSSGSMCLKAIRPLRLDEPASSYFEVSIGQNNIKRLLLGFCCPQDSVEASGSVRAEVAKRSWFLDSSAKAPHFIAFGGGDVVGVGVRTEGLQSRFWATLNGYLVFSVSMELPIQRDGSSSVTSIVPFISWDSTDRSCVSVKFGEAEPSRCESSNILCLGTRDPRLHDAVLDAMSKLVLPECVVSDFVNAVGLTSKNASRLLRMIAESTKHTPTLLHAAATLLERGCVATPTAVQRLLQHSHESVSKTLPFSPHWVCSSEESSFVAGPCVTVNEQHFVAHAVGAPIPSRGTCSFSVYISYHGTEQTQVQNFGQFYIGVTSLSASELSTSSWNQADPPTVWGVHSIASAQLRHCSDSAFAGDSFTFSANSAVGIELDRDAGTMSLTRNGKTFSNVFSGVPKDVELRPFVQLVDGNTSATLLPGLCSATVTSDDAFTSAKVRIFRALLCNNETERTTGEFLEKCFSGSEPLLMALRIVGAQSSAVAVDALELPLCSKVTGSLIDVDHTTMQASLLLNGCKRWFPLYLVDISFTCVAESEPLPPLQEDDDDDDETFVRVTTQNFGHQPLRLVAKSAIAGLGQWYERHLQPSHLTSEEIRGRLAIETESLRAISKIDMMTVTSTFKSLLATNSGLMSAVYQNASVPPTHTFNSAMMSPQLRLPKHYRGKLVISPAAASKDLSSCFTAIANEAINAAGITSIRVKVEFDWMGLLALKTFPMADGFYFGLCSEKFLGQAVDFALLSPAQAWAVTSFDSKEWHLPNSCRPPSCVQQIFSGDVLRLQVHREKGTLEVFRTPKGKSEVALGVLFRDIPKGENIFPFVRISSPRTAVLFLPESAILPRPIANQSRYAVSLKSKTHSCDGCLNQLVHAPIEAPNWYRCNECLDFDLCSACFQGHFHCGHTFTHMKLSSFIPSTFRDARQLTSGSEVEITAAPLFPLRAENAVFDDRAMRVSVDPQDTKRKNAAGGLWGIIRKATSPFEIAAQFTSCDDRRDDRILAGIAPLSLLESTTFDDLVTMLKSEQRPRNIVVFSAVREWVDHTGADLEVLVRGQNVDWRVGDVIAFQVTKDLSSIEVVRNGIACRTYTECRLWKQTDALTFFMISDGGSKVDLEATTQQTPIITGKIGEIDSKRKTFRITNGVANRWCHRSQLTLPLEPIKQHSLLREGLQVYLPQKTSNHFAPCVVLSCGDVDDPIRVHNGTEVIATSLDAIFVPRFVNTAKDPDDEHMYPDAKRRLRRFYAHYAAMKTEDDMDKAIELYAKRSSLKKMWDDLEKKYGPEPPLQVMLPPPPLVHDFGVAAKDVIPLIDVLRILLRFSEVESLRRTLDPSSIALIAPLLDYLSSQQLPSTEDNVAHWIHHIRVRDGDACRVAFGDVAVCDDTLDLPPASVPPLLCAINSVEGVHNRFEGKWSPRSMGLSYDVVVDRNRATIEFRRGGQVREGLYSVSFPVTSNEWNASSQRLRLGFGVPDDPEAFALLALMCGDPFLNSSSAPLILRAGEHMMFDSCWDSHQRLLAGEWRFTTGHRGHGVLKSDRPLSSPWSLPAPACVKDLTAATAQRVTKTSDLSAILLKTVAFLSMRLRLEWVEACLTSQSPARLLRELAHALPSVGVRKVLDVVTQLPRSAQESLLQRAMWMSAQPRIDIHVRITSARIIAHLAISFPEQYWSAVFAVVTSVMLQWNSLDLLDALAQLTKLAPQDERGNLATSLSPLYYHFASVIGAPFANATYLSLTMEIFRPVVDCMELDAFPVKGVAMLADVAAAMQEGQPLPLCLESWEVASTEPLKWTACGEATVIRGQVLAVGTVWSPLPPTSGAVYFEVTANENHVAIGCSAPSDITNAANDDAKKKFGPVLGFSATSVCFDGTCVYTNRKGTRCGYATILGNETLGALLHVAEGWVQFSVNGQVAGRFPLPPNTEHRAVIRCTTAPNNGCALRSTPERILSLPTGAAPLHGRLVDCSSTYSAASRSLKASTVPLTQWTDLANDPQQMALSECFQRTLPFVDLSIAGERGGLMQHFSTLKRMVLPSLRKELAYIPPLETVERRTLPQVAVKWFELFSHHERSADEALSRTVLSQLLRQLGSSPAAMQKDPMFVTALMMTESKHTPIDAGGPYSQVWSLVAEELMTDNNDPTTAAASTADAGEKMDDAPQPPISGPKQKFHRNPLFRFGVSAKGKVLVPERRCSSMHHLQLFTFFGAIMGYLLRSKRCLALEISPIVWKFLTEEPLTATDFVDGVDASLQTSLDDEDFIDSPDADVVFPGLEARFQEMSAFNPNTTRREAAEWALCHSLDEQLNAIREGFWSTVPRSTSRLLLPNELALKVCGEPFPTWEQLQQSITLTMPSAHQDMFWAAMKELSPAEWSGFFYFASAQRRFPLSRKISVTPTQQSEKHIPQASTCFNHVSTPLYSTVEIWITKLRQAISCQDMELA
jgi:hypothetical protein